MLELRQLCKYQLGDALKDFFFPGKFEFYFFPIFWKNWPKPPGESKTRCGGSGGINMSSIRANLTDFVHFFIFFENLKKFKKKWPKNKTFFNFFPTPQPPSHSPQTPKDAPDHAGVVGQSFIPIGPNGASFMPIFRFKFRHFFNHPPKTRLGTLGFTARRKGNLLFFIFY